MVSLHSLQECALFPQALFTAGNKESQTVTAMHYSVDNKLTRLAESALFQWALLTAENKELQTVMHYILDNNQMHMKMWTVLPSPPHPPRQPNSAVSTLHQLVFKTSHVTSVQ